MAAGSHHEATIRLSSLRNEAYDRIRGKLALGQLTAGSEVSEPMLAEMLGISRTPVREALQQLEVEGLVERNPRRRTVVRGPDRQDILDLYELREAVESFAVALAAKRHTAADLDRLEFLCREMKRPVDELQATDAKALSDTKLRRLLAADMGFHLLLIQAAGNRHIMKIVADSHVLSRLFGAPRQEHNLKQVSENYRVHRGIFEAVKSSDANHSRDLMTAHLEATLKEALYYYDSCRPGEEIEVRNTLDSIMPAYLLDEFKRIGLPLKNELN
jgi:DNA-binding GntR family transcriptional regulator